MLKKFFFIVLCLICFCLGTVGIILPVLPTAPFYLAALFFAAKSSERLHRFIINSKLYKKHLQELVETRSMPLKKKLLLIIPVSVLMIAIMVLVNNTVVYIVLSAVLCVKYYYFIFIIKTK